MHYCAINNLHAYIYIYRFCVATVKQIAPYMVKELVKYLISERIITLQELNDHISMFPYSPIDVLNKPFVISPATLN